MAELSEQIKLLASQRSTLKRKVTLLQNSLRQASNLAPTQLQQLHDELRTQYTNFVECHLEYSDLVQSDVAYDAHKIVNGLDLDQYLNSVDTVYNRGVFSHPAHPLVFWKPKLRADELLWPNAVTRSL